jgi:hypothetical protein
MRWTSATIARIGFPPPKPLTPAAERRLRIVSIVLVALGLTNPIRFLATGKRAKKRADGRRGSDGPATTDLRHPTLASVGCSG